MRFLDALVRSPVKVAVGVLLVVLFGLLALGRMPIQLTPEVQTPTISIRTSWPGASPQEFEREIVEQQEDFLKSIEGVTKMSSSSYGTAGRISLEFAIGTDMNEALLKVNNQLQQISDYPEDVDEPTVTTSNFADEPIAWFILSPRPPTEDRYEAFLQQHPELADVVRSVRAAGHAGLELFRLREQALQHPELEPLLPADQKVVALRRYVENNIAAAFERVDGVARVDIDGGLEDELQVVVDPHKLAARDVTITDVREALRGLNDDLPGGYFDEGKRRWFVRTLGRFESPEQVENELLDVSEDGAPLYVRDVAEVRLGLKDPSGLVRRFGASGIAVSVIRETGANVLNIMEGLRETTVKLNEGPLKQRDLHLTQLYDETEYIDSALRLVQSNLFIGGSLTMIVLMAFLHLNRRTMLVVPLIVASALAATYVSPWFFVFTVTAIVAAGFWFARGALVVGLVIPICIVSTFLMMDLFGRSLNVVSLAGLAFAVGMFVDNAIVVMESIHRRHGQGDPPVTAAVRGTQEVWGAVLASTLTNVAIFLPVVFIEQEAGQLFRDIALAISAALVLSLVASTIVIPAATVQLYGDHTRRSGTGRRRGPLSSRISQLSRPASASSRGMSPRAGRRTGGLVRAISGASALFVSAVVAINRWVQGTLVRRVAVVALLVGASLAASYALWPDVEYLPTGNRNLIVGSIRAPQGYNYDQMMQLGGQIEANLRPYWDVNRGAQAETERSDAPVIEDFYYVVNTWRVSFSVRARDPARAAELMPLIQEAGAGLPGTFVTSSQSSLFEQRGGGRSIDIEISGPDLDRLVDLSRQTMDTLEDADPDTPGAQPLLPGAQLRPNPELDMSSPEVHVRAREYLAQENDLTTTELGYTVSALVDGAYAGDYFLDGDKIDMVIEGEKKYAGSTKGLSSLMIATPAGQVVPLGSVASVEMASGPEQIDHREAMRAITVHVSPPQDIPLQEAMNRIRTHIVAPLVESGQIEGAYRIELGGTADKLRQAWDALRFNLVLALLITYLLMAALFESWLYPLVIIVSVPLGAVGGVLGLEAVNGYLSLLDWAGVPGIRVQQLDVLTMLGFVILVGTVVNNPILIVHRALYLIREEGYSQREAILDSTRTRIRPIFMTTTTTLLGLLPLVLFPGPGSELYRGLGSVLLGGLLVSTIFTLVLVPTLFSLMMDAKRVIAGWLGIEDEFDDSAAAETPAEREEPAVELVP